MHTYKHIFINIYIYVRKHIYICECIYMNIHINTYYMQVYLYNVCIHTQMYIKYLLIILYLYVYKAEGRGGGGLTTFSFRPILLS